MIQLASILKEARETFRSLGLDVYQTETLLSQHSITINVKDAFEGMEWVEKLKKAGLTASYHKADRDIWDMIAYAETKETRHWVNVSI